MLRWIAKTMGQGLMALIPLALTLGLVIWLGMWVENLLANPFKDLFPGSNEVYRVGMGIASFLLLLFLSGLLVKWWLVQKLLAMIEGWLMQLPLVKTVLGAIKDVVKFVSGGDGGKKGDMVVIIELDNGWRQIGIVTRQNLSDLPDAVGGGDRIAVYLPFSYQLGGFTYFMDRKQCRPVPGMSVEDAMRQSLMAWMGGSEAAKKETGAGETPGGEGGAEIS